MTLGILPKEISYFSLPFFLTLFSFISNSPKCPRFGFPPVYASWPLSSPREVPHRHFPPPPRGWTLSLPHHFFLQFNVVTIALLNSLFLYQHQALKASHGLHYTQSNGLWNCSPTILYRIIIFFFASQYYFWIRLTFSHRDFTGHFAFAESACGKPLVLASGLTMWYGFGSNFWNVFPTFDPKSKQTIIPWIKNHQEVGVPSST